MIDRGSAFLKPAKEEMVEIDLARRIKDDSNWFVDDQVDQMSVSVRQPVILERSRLGRKTVGCDHPRPPTVFRVSV
jgi:hypothetical protein